MNRTPHVRSSSAWVVALTFGVFGPRALAQPPDPSSGAAPSPASPQTPAAPKEVPPTTFRDDPASHDDVRAAFTPYVWLTGFDGTTGVHGLTLDLDVPFSAIFENSSSIFGLMGALDIEYKRLVFQLNGAYTHAEFSGDRAKARTGPLGGGTAVSIETDLEVDAAWFDGLGGFRLVDKPVGKELKSRWTLDGFVGGRITSMEVTAQATADATVTLPGGRVLEAGRERELGDSEGWFEPFVGAKTRLDLGQHWSLLLRGDVGGFGVDNSDFAWQVVVGAGYRWQCDGWTFGLFGGYRALSQDYSNDGFTWDAVTHGPILGAQFAFSF